MAVDVFGDELEGEVGDADRGGLGLLLENGETGLVLWRLDFLEHAAFEAGDETAFDGGGKVLRSDVGGKHDLLVFIAQGVEVVEELVLGLLAALEELDVVDQEDVERAVLVAELGDLALLHMVDVFVHVLLGGEVAD